MGPANPASGIWGTATGTAGPTWSSATARGLRGEPLPEQLPSGRARRPHARRGLRASSPRAGRTGHRAWPGRTTRTPRPPRPGYGEPGGRPDTVTHSSPDVLADHRRGAPRTDMYE